MPLHLYQVAIYRACIQSPSISSILYSVGSGSADEGVLPAITVLRKLCNHPNLLRQADKDLGVEGLHGVAAAGVGALLEQLQGFEADPIMLSGRLGVRWLSIVRQMHSRTDHWQRPSGEQGARCDHEL